MARTRSSLLAIIAALVAVVLPSPAGAFGVRYMYNLSSTTEVFVGAMAPRLKYDDATREVYVSSGGTTRIYSPNGIEIYSFEGPCAEGAMTPFKDGEFLVNSSEGLIRCDYRGDVVGRFEIKTLPPGVVAAGDRLAYVNGLVYFGNTGAKKVVVIDAEGAFVREYDLAAIVSGSDDAAQYDAVTAMRPDDPADFEIRGLSVDQTGAILFTVPMQFRAYVVSPDGQFRGFGKKGSAPGRFNVVGPIVRDENGFIYVGDMLRSVVMVFDPDLKFVREFGYRGGRPWNLATPADLAIGGGMLFVSSMSPKKGIVVFRVVS